jgi:hypothetical protein
MPDRVGQIKGIIVFTRCNSRGDVVADAGQGGVQPDVADRIDCHYYQMTWQSQRAGSADVVQAT